MRLFDYNRAPNPIRVRIFIAEKGLDIPLVKVDLMRREQLSPEYLQLNPGGTVPMLETDDGQLIAESLAICHYLEQLHPEPPLMGSTPAEQATVIMWNNIIEAQGIDAVAEVLRNVSPGFRGHAFPGPVLLDQIPDLVRRGQARVAGFFDRMEAHLGEHRYIAGDDYSFADISLLATIDFADWVETRATSTRPNLARWYQEISGRPATRV